MSMIGPAPGEESCGCGPTAVWGLADAADPRYLGGHVDREGWRHDPLVHADTCPLGETRIRIRREHEDAIS